MYWAPAAVGLPYRTGVEVVDHTTRPLEVPNGFRIEDVLYGTRTLHGPALLGVRRPEANHHVDTGLPALLALVHGIHFVQGLSEHILWQMGVAGERVRDAIPRNYGMVEHELNGGPVVPHAPYKGPN